MKVVIETARLIIKPLESKDYLDAFIWCSDKDVNKYLTYSLYTNPFKVKEYIESLNYDDPNYLDFGFYLKETNKPIGAGGFIYSEITDTYHLRYQLAKRYWGNGYTYEAIKGIINYLLKTKTQIKTYTLCAKDNLQSQRVIEKLKMIKIKETTYSKIDKSVTFPAFEYHGIYNKQL